MSESNLPLTDADLDAIRGRVTVATPGPWGYHTLDDVVEVAAGMGPGTIGSVSYVQRIARLEEDDVYDDEAHGDWDAEDARTQTEANAAFIAHARTDMPALLAEVDRLRARSTKQVERWDDTLHDQAREVWILTEGEAHESGGVIGVYATREAAKVAFAEIGVSFDINSAKNDPNTGTIRLEAGRQWLELTPFPVWV